MNAPTARTLFGVLGTDQQVFSPAVKVDKHDGPVIVSERFGSGSDQAESGSRLDRVFSIGPAIGEGVVMLDVSVILADEFFGLDHFLVPCCCCVVSYALIIVIGQRSVNTLGQIWILGVT